MRRSTRSAEMAVSDQIPESQDAASISLSTGILDDPAVPKFRFIQSSPHSGVSNVNGEIETVHWVVKDRPFAIRILEVPVVRGGEKTSPTSEDVSDEQDIAWNEVEVRADVVYTKTRKPVKMPSASEKSALSVDQSIIPASVYNHRRSANLIGQQVAYSSSSNESLGSNPTLQGSLLLKGGAGIELSVRLAVLSSHVRNDFCVHLQLFLRGQLISEWYSETIKSVSKWDKVRQLQDSTTSIPKSHHYNRSTPTHSNRTSRINSSTASSSPHIAINNGTIRTTRSQTSQKPVSASIKTAVDIPSTTANIPGNENIDSSSSNSNPNSGANSVDYDSSHQETTHRLSRAKPSSSRASSALHHDYMMLDEDRSSVSHGGKHGKKKKASGEEVFEMLDRLLRVQQEMSHLIQQQDISINKKKRSASWEPSAEAIKPGKIVYPSEQEAAEGARLKIEQSKSQNKKPKRAEMSTQTQIHSLPTELGTYKPGELAENINSFLHLLDQSVLAHVRSALTGFLLTRPDLAAILQRLMMTLNKETAVTPISEIPHRATWSQQDQIPMLNQSGYMWSDERYELGQSDGDRAMAEMDNVTLSGAFPVVAETPVVALDSGAHPANCYDTPVMSPFGLDDEDDSSTTMGSPSYAAWSDAEWSTTEPSTPFQQHEISPQNSSLTDSKTMFAGFLETPAGF